MSEYPQDEYYILLTTKIGKKKESGILRKSYSRVEVLAGTLLLRVSDSERDENGIAIWTLETLEPENIEVECKPVFDEIKQIDRLELQLLQPIPVCSERIAVYMNSNWLQEGLNLKVGDGVIVYLKGHPELQGLLRYRGELPGQKGIQFGVELAPEHRGKGTCDGVFRKKRFFTCEPNCGVFVPLHKIRADPTSRHAVNTATASLRQEIAECGLRIGNQIVWLSDNGPEYGEVKWVGVLPDSRRNDITVGVEFVNPVGSGTGKYKSHRLFHAKPQHASLVPIMGLMKAEEYLAMQAPTADTFAYGSPQPEVVALPPEDIKVPETIERVIPNSQQVEVEVHSSNRPQFVSPVKPIPQKVYIEESREPSMNPLYEYQINQKLKKEQSQQSLQSSEPGSQSIEPPGTRKSMKSIPPADPDLEVGSMVEVMQNPPLYGVIRWVGSLPDQKEPTRPIAGLEMEEEISAGTDGTFKKIRYFSCPDKKGFFVPLYKCRKDKRFVDQHGRGALGNNFGSFETPDVHGNISPPDSLSESEIGTKICGKQKGIQGHHNSCYLDATLFAMFYFTTVYDGILYRPKRLDDHQEYEEVINVLKEGIVNPLRCHFYVRADKVMKLRHLLDKLGNIPGMMSEEKDPEEFLSLLLGQITKADPFLQIKAENAEESQQSFLFQLFMEKDERLVLPTTQQLFELSFLQNRLKLQERPSCLIIQMPRFGKDFKMYKRIVPSVELDITDVLEKAPRECNICGDLACFECRECYNTHGDGLNTIAFCKPCKDRNHLHKLRARHQPQKICVPEEYLEYHSHQKNITGQNPSISRDKMELFAVVCIQTSHYVSFVKCGPGKDAPWVFFDSMADRMGEQSGYNIPEVQFCPDLNKWLSPEYNKEIIKREDDKDLPENIKRLLCDAYMCMYQYSDVAMFK
ncbi:ubiquitin carboxyl-terminal hydrolase CYLD-like [Mytilus galloprovincialis]|uniref:ubiquitinyl hydrolase 1 n=2 Tax=Mytilus galloprovincialis TaxID=29158 RepID=A0A8B6HE26_MYTGA|nr:ubiquitin thioesterase [Mytilus galloprovincialis]